MPTAYSTYTFIKSTPPHTHHYCLQRPGHLFLTGYFSEHLQRTEHRQCYFPTITLGEFNRVILLPSLLRLSDGARISGDDASRFLMRCPDSLPPPFSRPSSCEHFPRAGGPRRPRQNKGLEGGETVVAKARVVYPGWPTQWCLPRRTAAYGRTVWPRGRLVAR